MSREDVINLVEEFAEAEGVDFTAFRQFVSAPVGDSVRWIVELEEASCPWEKGQTLQSLTLMVNPEKRSVGIVQGH